MYRKITDDIFKDTASKPVPSPDIPYNKYSLEDVRKLAYKEKDFVRRIITEYSEKYAELSEMIMADIVRYEYGSCTGHTLSRGYYHRGDGIEMAVSNIERGKLLKKEPEQRPYKDYYRYGFDKNGNIICSEEITGSFAYYLEFIIHKDNREIGFVFRRRFPDYVFSHINMAVFDSNVFQESDLRITYRYSVDSINDICLYDYDDSGRRSSAAIVFNDVGSIFDKLLLYFYEYDENNVLLGMRDKDGYFYSVKGKNARKYNITALKAADEMEKILRSWDNIPDDVYALSVYYELNEADESAKIYIGFNTEEHFRESEKISHDSLEARWNYAYWLQNDKMLFNDNDVIHIRYIQSGGTQRLLVNAVKALRKKSVITEIFNKEIPVIIHDLEYSPHDAKYNLEANGKKLLPQDFIDFCGGCFSW